MTAQDEAAEIAAKEYALYASSFGNSGNVAFCGFLKGAQWSASQFAERERDFREAIEKIAETRTKCLLGRCCVEDACFKDDGVCSAKVTSHNAFLANAQIARAVLEKHAEGKR